MVTSGKAPSHRGITNSFGLMSDVLDTGMTIGSHLAPGLVGTGIGLARTATNLATMNAAEAYLGQPQTGFVQAILSDQSVREMAKQKAIEARAKYFNTDYLTKKNIRLGLEPKKSEPEGRADNDRQTAENSRDITGRLSDRERGVTSRGF